MRRGHRGVQNDNKFPIKVYEVLEKHKPQRLKNMFALAQNVGAESRWRSGLLEKDSTSFDNL